MPELPEVETLKRELARVLVGKKIKAFTSEKFALPLTGKKIAAVERRAKILIFELAGHENLLIHLKMTGQLIFEPTRGQSVMGGHPAPPTREPSKHTRAIFDFTDGSRLRFNDLRKFGWLKVLPKTEAEKIFDRHGPEPLSRNFSPAILGEIIKHYPRRRLKQILLDQQLIAGLGNIYVDEACFLAGVRPDRLAASLSKKEIEKLYHSIVSVLKLSIAKKGTSARNYRRSNGGQGRMVAYLKVYGRGGQSCKQCRELIQKIKLNGRGTHFCLVCQK